MFFVKVRSRHFWLCRNIWFMIAQNQSCTRNHDTYHAMTTAYCKLSMTLGGAKLTLIWAKTIPAKMHTTDLLLITKMHWYTWKGPQRCFGRKWLHLVPFCNQYHIIPTWSKDLVRNMFRGFLTLSNLGCSSLLARAAALRILFLRTMRTGASAWCRSCCNNPV